MKQIILCGFALFLAISLIAQPAIKPVDTASSAKRGRPFYYPGNNFPSQNQSGSGHPYSGHYHNNFSQPIANYNFRMELRNIRNLPNQRAKKFAAKQLANAYSLTSFQVGELCNLFYSYARLDIAKYCYTRCYDPGNFYVVISNMDMPMAEEMNDYISTLNDNEYDQGYDPGYPVYGVYSNCMSQKDFNVAKQTISNSSFDHVKLETAKTILGVNYINTDQVMELCHLFDFEATKLDFARFAYDRTTDKNTYYKVGNVFDFDASRSALNQFLQQQRG